MLSNIYILNIHKKPKDYQNYLVFIYNNFGLILICSFYNLQKTIFLKFKFLSNF